MKYSVNFRFTISEFLFYAIMSHKNRAHPDPGWKKSGRVGPPQCRPLIMTSNDFWGIFFHRFRIAADAEPWEPENTPSRQLWRNGRLRV